MEINEINNIGFVGLGVMGMSMFKNLSKSRIYKVIGFDIDRKKMDGTNLKKSKSIEEIFIKTAYLLLLSEE